MRRVLPIFFAAVMLVACAALAPAHAVIYDLADANSTISITSESANGAYNWVVNGVYQLYQEQWFYGTSAPGQSSISALTLTGSSSDGTDAKFTYAGADFTLKTTYSLVGGAAGTANSDLSEQFRVINTSGSPLTFRLYLYTDFDLAGTPAGDIASIESPEMDHAFQYGPGKNIMSETVAVQSATHGEVNFYANTLNSLTSGVTYTLNDNVGPLGPGDMTWALEWDKTIAPGGSFIVSIDKMLTPVPLPPSVLMLGTGLLGLGILPWRKKTAV